MWQDGGLKAQRTCPGLVVDKLPEPTCDWSIQDQSLAAIHMSQGHVSPPIRHSP